MNVVVMGCGRAGAMLATLLDRDGHQVVVLDINPESLKRLPSDYGGTALIGDGTDEDTLKRAGIETADAFVALTEGDNRNVMAAQIAKHIFNVQRVMCRIYDPLREELYETLGLDALCPTTIFAHMLRDKLSSK